MRVACNLNRAYICSCSRPYRKLIRAVCSFLRLPAIMRCGHTANSFVLSVRSCGCPQSCVAVYRKLIRAVCSVVRLPAITFCCGYAAISVVPWNHAFCRNHAVGRNLLCGVSANSCLLFHAVGRKHLPIPTCVCAQLSNVFSRVNRTH